ncbi:MAG: HEPN domain-containing protein [Planctomycetes bacterium]|nr:HEPN domain-containing protein [Planctomycetota bacterium]
MRHEANDLWSQAKAELDDAVAIFGVRRWAKVCFSCEMAVQMALKAMIVERTGKPHPKIHKLRELGRLAGCPGSLTLHLDLLDPYYMETRYPDVGGKIPALLFTEQQARPAFDAAVPILSWAAKELGTDEPKSRLP